MYGDDPTWHVVGVEVLLPHLDEVLGAEDERGVAVLLAQHQRRGDGGQGLAEADHVAEHRAATVVDAPCERLDGVDLVFEQLLAHRRRKAVLDEALPHVAGQVPADLQEDLVRGEAALAGPRLVDQLDEVSVMSMENLSSHRATNQASNFFAASKSRTSTFNS